jgi:hypothetical protein
MIIATRTLMLRSRAGKEDVPIQIYAPEEKNNAWNCRFEIGWPSGTVERWGTGSDAVQSLVIAMQMIGAEIYASRYHEAGQIEWLAAGRGYGFPVANNIRDLLVGDDKKYL